MGKNMVDLSKKVSRCKKRQRIIVSAENKLEHIAVNVDNNLVAQYKVDGDIFTSADGTRADFLVLNLDKKDAYIIELKHDDIEKGIKQILATRECFKGILEDYNYMGRLVYASATHNVMNSLKTKKKRKMCSWIIISSVKFEEKI